VPELPRDVLMDMQRSVGNRAVSAVLGGSPAPPVARSARGAGPAPQLPPEAQRVSEPPGRWIAPFGLGEAATCGDALAIGVALRSRLRDASLRRELTAALRELGSDPARPLTRPAALRLAGLGQRAMRQDA
jgi:hypothetical protein